MRDNVLLSLLQRWIMSLSRRWHQPLILPWLHWRIMPILQCITHFVNRLKVLFVLIVARVVTLSRNVSSWLAFLQGIRQMVLVMDQRISMLQRINNNNKLVLCHNNYSLRVLLSLNRLMLLLMFILIFVFQNSLTVNLEFLTSPVGVLIWLFKSSYHSRFNI